MSESLQKAVILLASIPESLSAVLIHALEPDAIERLADAAAAVSQFTAEDQQRLAAEFVDRQLQRQRRPVCVSACSPFAALPEAQRNLADLQQAPADWLAQELAHELPQTAAVVMCQLPPTQAAIVLSRMSTEVQLQVVQRIATAGRVPAEIVAELLEALARRRRGELLRDINQSGGLPFVAQLVNRLDRATERALLQNLAQENRGLVDHLLRLMFVLRDRSRVCQPSASPPALDSPRKAA
jgi:flagellar motor switch protein FliG